MDVGIRIIGFGFSGLPDVGFLDIDRVLLLGCWLVWMLDLVSFFGFGFASSDLDRFRLLIQRWKTEGGIRNFFDKGEISPDESGFCPTKGIPGCKRG
jgi:hypothetical protein